MGLSGFLHEKILDFDINQRTYDGITPLGHAQSGYDAGFNRRHLQDVYGTL